MNIIDQDVFFICNYSRINILSTRSSLMFILHPPLLVVSLSSSAAASVRSPPDLKNRSPCHSPTPVFQSFFVCFVFSFLHTSLRPCCGELLSSSGLPSSSSLASPSQIFLISSLHRRRVTSLALVFQPLQPSPQTPSFAPVSALFYYSFHPPLLSSASLVHLFARKDFSSLEVIKKLLQLLTSFCQPYFFLSLSLSLSHGSACSLHSSNFLFLV